MVVNFPPGGAADQLARSLSVPLQDALGQSVIVENIGGASGALGAQKVLRAPADGYTLLVWHIGMAATAGLYRKLPYKPLEDFEYLGMINDVPMTLIGAPKLPASTYRDFDNYIRTNGG